MNLFYKIFYLFESFIIFYVATINTIYLFLMVLGFYVLRNRPFTLSKLEYEALQKSSLLPTISVLAPAYNEAKTIADSVRSMLKLNYPNYEVIVINDGSKDETLEILKQEFKLYKSSRQPSGRLHTKPIKTIYESRDPIRLIVIDKENGGKSDSLNVGLDVSRANLTAVVDSDSILETDALLLAVRPFLEDSTTLASGGIIRVANGSAFRYGQITEVSAPNSFLAQLQAVEYLRAFLGGRVAFSFINSLFIISGAFGLFRRSAVIEVGGFSTDTVGEDMELIMRLHHVWRNSKREYKIVFIPDPVCWTEVPEDWKTLHRQRNRWQRGTVESLQKHKEMLLNPRFGILGMLAFPYFLLFEAFGPTVELAGYILTTVGLIFGIISLKVAVVFFTVSVLFGSLLSVSALILEEFTLRRYPKTKDVLKLFKAAIVESFGPRQLMSWWRFQGLIDGLRGKKGWGKMERRGFQQSQQSQKTQS